MNTNKQQASCLHSFGSTTTSEGTWYTCFNCGTVLSDLERKMILDPHDWYKDKVHQHFLVTIEHITFYMFFLGSIFGFLIGKII